MGSGPSTRDKGCLHVAYGAPLPSAAATRRFPAAASLSELISIGSQHAELYDILYDAATRAGAEVEFDSEVVEIDTEEREVTLSSGTTLSADVLVGADGEYGPCRAAVIGQKVRGTPTGLALYECVRLIPALRPVRLHPLMRRQHDRLQRSLTGAPRNGEDGGECTPIYSSKNVATGPLTRHFQNGVLVAFGDNRAILGFPVVRVTC